MKTDPTPLRELGKQGPRAVPAGALEALAVPPPIPSLEWDRVEGMLLGLAIGDALGNTTEAALPGARRAEHGEIRDYLPNRHAEWARVGLPSDDSQLSFWTLEHLLEHGRIVPEALAHTFATREIFGKGRTVAAFRRAIDRGEPWHRAAPRSAGNGAVMRIAPVLIPHLRRPSPALWEDVILAAAVTHDDATSYGACVALAGILWELLAATATPAPAWWLDRYRDLARGIERDARLRPRKVDLDYEGPLWRFVDTIVREALDANLSVAEAGRIWHSGAYLLETLGGHLKTGHTGTSENRP